MAVPHVAIIGGGLAGSEAALQLARHDVPVVLYEMKPLQRSPAHHSNDLAEIVCSNSLGNLQPSTASGLLKAELTRLDCQLLAIARCHAVPAGNALAVDREAFSKAVTDAVDRHPRIRRVAMEITDIPSDAAYTLIATGPLTSPGLSQTMQRLFNQEQLYFFDAAAPIVTRDSIDFDRAFYQNRYDREISVDEAEPANAGAYINCPLTQDQYASLVSILVSGEKTPLKAFETHEGARFFESCLPVEVLAVRGRETLRYGPMKPVGLVDPKTGRQPYAVVQLRQDNAAGTLYNLVGFQTNLKWGVQKELIQSIPGLENAEIVRYGVMHRNTFLNSPALLTPTMQLRQLPHLLVAGQLTGVEGYTECIASGLMAAWTIRRSLAGELPKPMPPTTMMGALFQYITRPGVRQFQPINSNWGILPLLSPSPRDRQQRNAQLADRALTDLATFLQEEVTTRPVGGSRMS